MDNCIFCKIVAKEIPSTQVYEDNQFLAFHDIHPRARVHLLVMPKAHIVSLAALKADHQNMMGKLMLLLPTIAQQQGLGDGFRTIINTGKGGGQEVGHLHCHILGGGRLPAF